MTSTTKEKSSDHKVGPLEYQLIAVSVDENLPALNNQSLHRYLQEINQFELLSREETDELAVRFRTTADPDAAYRLVSANLRLVVKVAMDFQKHWMQNFMDLIQEGNVGLVQAAKKFDPYRGVKFSYFAAYWIRAYILKFIMDNYRLAKIGTTLAQRKIIYSLNKEKKLLEAQGLEAEPKLLAQRLSVKGTDIVEMSQRMGSCDVSFESPSNQDCDDDKKSFVPSPDPGIESLIAGREMRHMLSELIDTMKFDSNGKEKMILDRRLLTVDPFTLQNIAESFAISRERVRQIEVNLQKKIRRVFEEEMPDIVDFIDGEKMVV